MSDKSKLVRQPRKAQRLGRVLLNIFFVLAFIPIIFLTAVSVMLERQNDRARVQAQMSTLADAESQTIQNWATSMQSRLRQNITDSLRHASLLQLVTSGQDSAVLRAVFREYAISIIDPSTSFDRIIIVDAYGIVRGSNDQTLYGYNFSNEPWFREALLTPTPNVAITGPYRDPVDGQESLYFAIAIREMGQDKGVLLGRTSLKPLVAIMSASPVSTLGQTVEVFLVGQGQQYIVPPRRAAGAVVASDEIIPQVLSGENGTGIWTDYRGERVVGAYRWIDSLNIGLVIKQDGSEAFARGITFTQIGILIGVVAGTAVLVGALIVSRSITTPLEALGAIANRISQGDLTLRAPDANILEMQILADSFNQMTAHLKSVIEAQEQTIKARTRQLEITNQIGRAISAETDLERLLNLTVNAICDQLGHYHAQVFLLDDLRQYAVLRASTGQAGKKLLERGHKLAVGSRSVIGQVTLRGEPVLASDTRRAEFWMPNPFLPETRAELAIPLRLGGQIIGALDVQSVEPDVFDEETIAALQTVSDQLAVAIHNAQLFREKEGLLSASLQLTQTLTRDSWESYVAQRMTGKGVQGFQYDLSGVRPLDEASVGEGNGYDMSLPIALRGHVIGELAARQPKGMDWTEEEKQLVGQVLERVALALENARLFEQTQQSLMETNRLYRASQRIAAVETMDDLVGELIDLLVTDVVDRVLLLLLDNPEAPDGGGWVEVVGLWARDPADPLNETPKRLAITQSPLLDMLFREGVPAEGAVINDVEARDLEPGKRDILRGLNIKSLAIFPLVVGRRTLAYMLVQNVHQARAFGESDLRFYRALADQAATALEGIRLLEQARVRARRLQATNEVSRAISSILNPDILLPLIVEQISKAFDYYHVQIFLIDELGEWANLRASTGPVGQELLRRGHRLAVGSQSVIGQVTALGEVVIAHDTDTDPVHRRNELLPDTRAEMAIPLKTGDRVIGALDVQSTQPAAFDLEAQVILQSLADEIAVTLENAQLFQEIQDRVAELTTINLVSQAISRTETLDALYQVVTVHLMRTFGAHYGVLGVLNKQGLIEFPVFIEKGERIQPPEPQPPDAGLSGHVMRSKRMLLINQNVAQEAERLGARIIGVVPKSLLMVPLLIGDEAIGVISVQDAERENAYNEAHVRQLNTLAAYIAIKIHNAELLEEAQRQAAELGFLFNVTRAAVGSGDLDTALESVAKILWEEIEGAEAAVIYLTSQDGSYLEPHAAVGYGRDIALRETQIPLGSGVVGTVAATGRSQIISGAHQEILRNNGGRGRSQSCILVPLVAGQEVIGVFTVESTQPNRFGKREQRLLEAAAGTLTAIIQNARLLERIQQAHEKLKELDKLKTQFLANMSHELRTPLNSIIGFSRVMLKGINGPLTELQAQDLTTIYTSGKHLLGLINDILDLSKIEAGKMEINPEYTNLVEIIDGTMASGQGLIKDKPIVILRDVEENLPLVYADPVRIRQVLLNLVSNAAKFTHQGSITIRARRMPANPQTGDPPHVQVDVIDTGIGIAEKDMDKLFEAFQQVDGSTTRQVGGTGLGLPISRSFVEMHGGRMWVESEVGVGSTFSFTIPLHPPTSSEQVVVKSEDTADRPVILAVDADARNLELYQRYLEKAGYAMVGLNSADDLLAHVRQINPFAVVLEVNLPDGNGWQVIADLRQDKELGNIPIIVCSLEEDRERGQSLGVNEYLIKPILGEDLVMAIRRVESGPPTEQVKGHDVLIIDADETYAQALKQILEDSGRYSVRTAAEGYEGLQAIDEQKPDLLILDPDLPMMNGVTGLLAPMGTRPELQDIPVALLTRRKVPDGELQLLQNRLVRYLSKDVYQGESLLNELQDILREALKMSW